MSTFQPVVPRFLRSIADATYALSRPSVIVPFALMSLVQVLALAAYLFFANPPLDFLVPRMLAAVAGEASLHYPEHLLALPETVVWIRTAAWVAVGLLVVGASARRVTSRLRERGHIVHAHGCDDGPGALYGLAVVVIFRGVYTALHALLGSMGDLPIVGRFGPLWSACDAVLGPLATLAIAYAWVAGRDNTGMLRRIGGGLRLLVANAGPSLLLCVAVAILAAPFEVMTSSVAAFVRAGQPGGAVFGAAAALLWDAPLRLILFASAISLTYGRRDGEW